MDISNGSYLMIGLFSITTNTELGAVATSILPLPLGGVRGGPEVEQYFPIIEGSVNIGWKMKLAGVFELIVDASFKNKHETRRKPSPSPSQREGNFALSVVKHVRQFDELDQPFVNRLRAHIRSLPLPVLYLLTFRSVHSPDAAQTLVKI